jgi:vacuolar protein sorting-associated protein 13D
MRRARPAPPPSERTSSSGNGESGASDGRGILFQWFPTWWGWKESKEATENSSSGGAQGNTVEQQIEGQLLDALADTVENNSLLRRDVVFCQINFTLKEGTFHLCSTDKNLFPEVQQDDRK